MELRPATVGSGEMVFHCGRDFPRVNLTVNKGLKFEILTGRAELRDNTEETPCE
jgi:hypothetical protein